MWRAMQDTLQAGKSQKEKVERKNENCCLCGVSESADHYFILMSYTHIASSVWSCFKDGSTRLE
jgi:ribosomal protein S27AE